MQQQLIDVKRTKESKPDLVRYILYALTSLLAIALTGQLLAQLYSVRQLPSVKGKVVAKSFEITGYSAGGKMRKGEPLYSLIVTLDNNKDYTVDIDESNWDINNQMFIGQVVTIYFPTKIYNLLSLDCLDFGSRVCQVEDEFNHTVLLSFKHHQNKAWTFIFYLIAAIIFHCIALNWHLNEGKSWWHHR